MPHRRQNKYQRPPLSYIPPMDPSQQAIYPPVGGGTTAHPMVPPPIVDTPPPGYAMYPLTPPIGGVLPQSTIQPPLTTGIASPLPSPPVVVNPTECCSFDPPLSAPPLDPSLRSTARFPQSGTPKEPQTPTGIPSYPIKPPVSGPPMPYQY